MASLYDLELQESNNFIHALVDNGKSPALKLILDQKEQFAAMGDAAKVLLEQFEDENSELGKSLKKLNSLEGDIKEAMQQVGMTPELAAKANSIFSTSPESLSSLSPEDQDVIKDYWLKKKSIIVILLQKGYSHSDLFA